MLRLAGLILLIACAACAPRQDSRQADAARAREQQDRNSAAFKAGRVAHELAKETGKAAAAAGRKIDESARKAHEGWKEQARQDRVKPDTAH